MNTEGGVPVVLCDANVIYKNLLRDLLVRLAVKKYFAPRWTAQIHEEWISNLLAHRPDLHRSGLERTRDLMNGAIPASLVEMTFTSSVTLPDPNDQHVLDAALSASASLLLTFNLSDFPADTLPRPLQAIHPDAFLLQLLQEHENGVLEVIHALRADLKKPPFSPDELLAAFVRAEVPGFAERLAEFRERI